MNEHAARLQNAIDVALDAPTLGDLAAGQPLERRELVARQRLDHVVEASGLAVACRAPQPAGPPQRGIDGVLFAERRDLADRVGRRASGAHRLVARHHLQQRRKLGPQVDDVAGVPAARAAAADVALDHDDIARRFSLLDGQRRPQAAEAAADDDDVRPFLAGQRGGHRRVGGEGLRQPMTAHTHRPAPTILLLGVNAGFGTPVANEPWPGGLSLHAVHRHSDGSTPRTRTNRARITPVRLRRSHRVRRENLSFWGGRPASGEPSVRNSREHQARTSNLAKLQRRRLSGPNVDERS